MVQRHDVDGAIACFERSVAVQPQDWRSYYYLGIAYDHKGDKPKATEAYKKAESLRQ